MKFSNYLNSKYVFTDIKANTKEEVIEEIVNRLMDKNPIHVSRKEEVLNSILKREKKFLQPWEMEYFYLMQELKILMILF